MTTSAPRPSVSSHAPRSTTSTLERVDDVVGLDGVGRHRQPLGVDVDQDDRARLVHAARDPDVHAADRAGAEDDDDVALLDAELLLGVDRAGERLGGGGLVEADVVRDPVQAVDLQHLLAARSCTRRSRRRTGSRPRSGSGRRPSSPCGTRSSRRTARPRSPARGRRPAKPPSASAPTSTTSPAISWPIMRGGVMFDVAVVEDLHVGAAGRAVADPDLDLVRAAAAARGRPRAARRRGRRSAVPSWFVTPRCGSGGRGPRRREVVGAAARPSAPCRTAWRPARPGCSTCSSLFEAIGMHDV